MANEISKTPTQAKPQVIPLSKIHDLPNVFIAKPQDKSLGSMVPVSYTPLTLPTNSRV